MQMQMIFLQSQILHHCYRLNVARLLPGRFGGVVEEGVCV
jgi:hypothetical protein